MTDVSIRLVDDVQLNSDRWLSSGLWRPWICPSADTSNGSRPRRQRPTEPSEEVFCSSCRTAGRQNLRSNNRATPVCTSRLSVNGITAVRTTDQAINWFREFKRPDRSLASYTTQRELMDLPIQSLEWSSDGWKLQLKLSRSTPRLGDVDHET